jgi:hypothetical protein
MLLILFMLLLLALFFWSRRVEGMTQSCTDQFYLQHKCSTASPVPFCSTNDNNLDKINCMPMPQDGVCPAPYSNPICPGLTVFQDGVCAVPSSTVPPAPPPDVPTDKSVNKCSPKKDCKSCSKVPIADGNCYWCNNANQGKGGCFDANVQNTCPDFTLSKGGCLGPLCTKGASSCPK